MASDTTRSFRSLMIGGQHALAAVGGIIAAPLVIALGMGLSAADTRYVISAALVISGIATVIQILRIGPIGSGLLSIQGTSFAFVGPLIFVFSDLSADLSAQDALGVIFGSALVCSAAMILLAAYVDKLRSVVTSNVTGLTLLLIGLTLVEGTSRALWGAFNAAIVPWQFLLICSVTLLVLGLSLALPKLHLRWVAIILALAVGTGVATLFGEVDWRLLSADAIVFLPEFGRFGFSVDWMVVLILMPIFLVSATESIGDLTATNALSGYPTGDSAYWGRVRGGLMGDALNSGLASAFATFPNTTFSQNNGLIRSNRRITAPYRTLCGDLHWRFGFNSAFIECSPTYSCTGHQCRYGDPFCNGCLGWLAGVLAAGRLAAVMDSLPRRRCWRIYPRRLCRGMDVLT